MIFRGNTFLNDLLLTNQFLNTFQHDLRKDRQNRGWGAYPPSSHHSFSFVEFPYIFAFTNSIQYYASLECLYILLAFSEGATCGCVSDNDAFGCFSQGLTEISQIWRPCTYKRCCAVKYEGGWLNQQWQAFPVCKLRVTLSSFTPVKVSAQD